MFFVGLSGFIVTLSLAVSFPGIFILFCLGAFPQSAEQIIPKQNIHEPVWFSSCISQSHTDAFHFHAHQATPKVQYRTAIRRSQFFFNPPVSLIASIPPHSVPIQQRAIIHYSGLRAPPVFF